MQDKTASERVHIGFFGCRNAGKSSLVNAVTGQKLALVSDIKGTTTDPVKKTMELLPLGPVVIIDTPGFDDTGTLGEMRVKATVRILNDVDIAILCVDVLVGLTPTDRELIALFKKKKIAYIIAYNKADLLKETKDESVLSVDESTRQNADISVEEESAVIYVSASEGTNIYELKEKIGHLVKETENSKRLVGDLVSPGDVVILVTPIDSAAPKGRLILPQQLVIRDLLESAALPFVVRETELAQALDALKQKPAMVITDSQAFKVVSQIVPKDIYLTSFSILMMRYKNGLEIPIRGARHIEKLKDGDIVLISEGCTHHRQCGDIGTVKLPNWIRSYTQKDLQFEFTSGNEFPEDLDKYAMVIHCGGCMLNAREMQYRFKCAEDQNVAITNYGICISYINGILDRTIEIFKGMSD